MIGWWLSRRWSRFLSLKHVVVTVIALTVHVAHAQQIGATSYTTLPFVKQVYRPCWQCTAGLDPTQLFFSANPHSSFLNTTLMAKVHALSAQQSAAGFVPTAGMQRWEDTYEASFPAGTFPGEPAWIAADRTAGKFSGSEGIRGLAEFHFRPSAICRCGVRWWQHAAAAGLLPRLGRRMGPYLSPHPA